MLILARLEWPEQRAVACARGLLLAVVVTMLVSTSAAIFFEFLAYLTFLVQPALRRRIVLLRRHPVAIGLLVFMVPIVAGAFYGGASWHDALTSVFAWRRVLVLPMALAVFNDEPSKRLVAKVLLAATLVGAGVSFVTAGFDVMLTNKIGKGVVFQNYTTQGLAMTIAMIVALAMLLRRDAVRDDRFLGNPVAMLATIAVLAADIIFVLPGRSAYGAVVVMGAAVVILLIKGPWHLKFSAGAALATVLVVLLASSTVTRNRVIQAVNEIATADEVEAGTSFGQRVVFLRYTARMVADHPLFGVGTGGFLEGYRPYVRNVQGWQGQDTGDPHNQFLKILSEQGLVGLLAFMFFLVRSCTCPAPTPYRQLAVSVLLGWCATSLANSHFSTFVESRMIFFWLGAMLAAPSELRNPASPIT